ncbi:MAG: hypothetical protein AAF678_02950 [Pseudomonadota bacterium]
MNKYGPSRGELRFRLIVGLLGVTLTLGAAVYIKSTSGAHLGELLVVGLGFFGGTAVHAGWTLHKADHPPPDQQDRP